MLRKCVCYAIVASCIELAAAADCVSRSDIVTASGKCLPVDGAVVQKEANVCADGRYDDEGLLRTGSDGGNRPHLGLDLAAEVGTKFDSAAKGTVWAVLYRERTSGLQINIRHEDGSISRYFHLDTIDPTYREIDTLVVAGQRIGTTGVSGNASMDCPHLHFEIRERGAFDPQGNRVYSRTTINPTYWLSHD